MALEKLEIETYKLERGEYYVSSSVIGHDLESQHRIFLLSKADTNGIQKGIELEFSNDRYLKNYISEGVGYASASENRILIRYRLSEFEPTYDILRSEKPVFFEYDQFPGGPSPNSMRVNTARITTSSKETGRARQI